MMIKYDNTNRGIKGAGGENPPEDNPFFEQASTEQPLLAGKVERLDLCIQMRFVGELTLQTVHFCRTTSVEFVHVS